MVKVLIPLAISVTGMLVTKVAVETTTMQNSLPLLNVVPVVGKHLPSIGLPPKEYLPIGRTKEKPNL